MYLFTSEAVSPGHPDKCADIVADSVVDYLLQRDSASRVAAEVFIAGKNLVIGGEVKTSAHISADDYKSIAKAAIEKIGYNGKNGFKRDQTLHPDDLNIEVYVNKQSPDISQGVDQSGGEVGAGDQGIMFGFASAEAAEYMPAAISFARGLCDFVYRYALSHNDKLGIDIKTQVTIDYGTKDNFIAAKPQKIHTIVVSAPSVERLHIDEVRKLIKGLIDACPALPKELYDPDDCVIHINPTGRYVNHGPLHDSGLTGRKLIVDSFGGYAPIGGGAQSSKDYTKVDRSGLYAARWIAKNIVAAGLAKKALVQIGYAIGVAKPVSISVDTQFTASDGIKDEELSAEVAKRFALTPNWIAKTFNLDKPSETSFLYAEVAARGQVGIASYPWEQIDRSGWFESLRR
ncbi:MAG: methionine adenosyltransferase [Helicobacteraceae bacterium]|jgi:S-adenosylmethionine synthetase|nr:methionine adenosyltransferase [Helicobacteraceae bacterium]